jgi:hypothetical protein
MSGRDNERALADAIADRAVDGETAGRVVGDEALVLLVLGVAEERHTLDLLPDGSGAVADGRGEEGGALAREGMVNAGITSGGGTEWGVCTCTRPRRPWTRGIWYWPA